MSIVEHIASRDLPVDQRAYHCSADGASLCDIYEFDVNHTVGVIWSGKVDLSLLLGAAARIGTDLESTARATFNVTYIADETLIAFPWQVGVPRTAEHRAFLRAMGHAVSYVHCDSTSEQAYSLWAQVHAPLTGQIGFCGPAAPPSLYTFMTQTDVTSLRAYDHDVRELIEHHLERMRHYAKDQN